MENTSKNNIGVVFATPKVAADNRMLRGDNLGIWKSLLQARIDAVDAYIDMEKSIAFTQPISYADASACDYDALMLPGGHDKGVREYLESTILQKLVVDFFLCSKTCRGNMSWYSIGSMKYRSSYQQISNL